MISHEEYWKQFLDHDMIKYCSITDFKGMTIGINASNWLEKALSSCIDELIENQFKDYMFYVDQILSKVRNFRIAGVEPVMVFEGKRNLLKTEAQIKREESRQMMLDQGNRLLECYKSTHEPNCKHKIRQEAMASLQKGLKPSPEMIANVIAALKQVGITVIVAPCEVDAQLVHLCINGVCQAVISENFDVMIYSLISRYSFPLIYKFEHTGNIQVISLKSLRLMASQSKNLIDLPQTSGLKRQISIQSAGSVHTLNICSILKEFVDEHDIARISLHFLLLAGCVFVEPLREMTLRLALELVQTFLTIPCDSRLVQIVKYLQAEEYETPLGYLERLLRAEAIYYYHPIYDPLEKRIKPFTTPNILTVPLVVNSQDEILLRPLIHETDLLKLKVDSILLEKAPANVTIADICEASVSPYTYATIIPRFPWDLPDLRPTLEVMVAKDTRIKHGVWGTRSSLMKCLSPTLSSSSSSSDSQSSQESPLADNCAASSQVPTLNIFGVPAMGNSRRSQKRKANILSLRSTSPRSPERPKAVDPCLNTCELGIPKSPPDVKKGSQIPAEFHSPPNSQSSSLTSPADTISPPSDRHSCAAPDEEVTNISPDIDRLGCILDQEEDEREKEGEKRRISRSPEQKLRKKRRKSADEIVTLSLNKGKKEKQKTMTVASIKSYFR